MWFDMEQTHRRKAWFRQEALLPPHNFFHLLLGLNILMDQGCGSCVKNTGICTYWNVHQVFQSIPHFPFILFYFKIKRYINPSENRTPRSEVFNPV